MNQFGLARDKINQFMATKYYPIVIAAMGLLCHLFGLEYIYFTVITLLLVYVSVFNGNGLRIVPLVLISLIALSRVNTSYVWISELETFVQGTAGTVYVSILTAIGGMALAWMCVKTAVVRVKEYRISLANRPKDISPDKSKEKKPWTLQLRKKQNIYIGLIAMSAVYILGGLFFPGFNPGGLLFSFALAAIVLVGFVIFDFSVKWDKDSMNFICDCFAAMLAVIVIQMLWMYIDSEPLHYAIINTPWNIKSYVFLGWSPSNHIAIFITLILPFVMYRMFTARRAIVYFCISYAAIFAIVLTFSRNAILFGIPMFAGLSLWALIKARDKKTLRIAYVAALALTVVIMLIFLEQLEQLSEWFSRMGLSDSGRFDLFRLAWEHFLQAPIFGVGLGYLTGEGRIGFGVYHNHILQFLASLGLVGLGAYIFHRYQTVRLLINKPDLINIFAFVSLGMFVATSILDITLFAPMTMALYPIVMLILSRNQPDFGQKQNVPIGICTTQK